MRLTPAFFMERMRGYLAPLSIGGHSIEGPNATYTPGWVRMDYALGHRSISYVATVEERFRWMIPEHRILLEQSLELKSLPSQFIEQLGEPGERINVLSDQELNAVILETSPAFQASARALARLIKVFTVLSSTHFSMIQNYLVKPASKLDPEQLRQIVPSPGTGVGGNGLAHTKAILDYRRGHPINAKLVRAIGA